MPTFGYTTTPASSYAMGAGDVVRANLNDVYASASSGDTVTKFTAYTRTYTSGSFGLAAYSLSSGLPNTKTGATGTVTSPASPAWTDSGAVSIALSAGAGYCVACGEAASAPRLYYDTLSNSESRPSADTTFPATWTHLAYNTQRYGIYATYTAAGGGSPYTLVAGVGSYTLSGQTVTLKYGRVVSAALGTYSLSGQAVTTRRGYPLTASVGAYSLAGQTVGLRADRKLASAAGAYSVAGQAVNTLYGRLLSTTLGTYNLSGQAVTLTYTPATGAYTLVADVGAYSLSGKDVTLEYGRNISASAGSYALSGKDVNLEYGRKLTADAGGYSLSGQNVTLTYTPTAGSYTLVAEAGSYSLSGQDVALTYIQNVTSVSSGGWSEQPYRKRKRYKIETEEDKEAVEIIERVVESVAKPDTTQDDLELALRLALLSSEIKYRAIYLRMALDELEQIRRNYEAAMEEEAAIYLLMVA